MSSTRRFSSVRPRSTIRLIGVLLCAGLASSGVADESALDSWINKYYYARALCANSTIENTVLDANHLRVDLQIDERWAKSMESFDKSATERWFAIHCPLPFESVQHLLGDRDIVINTDSLGDSPRTMSCRAFSESMRSARQKDKAAARSRLESLLDRLGLSG